MVRPETLGGRPVQRLQVFQPIASFQYPLTVPPDAALEGYPCIELQAAAARDICHGKRVDLACEILPGLYRLMAADGDFIGLGEVRDGGELAAKRLMNTAG